MANTEHSALHEIAKPFIPRDTDYTFTAVQTLWSGYGEITRCQLSKDKSALKQSYEAKYDDSFIIKTISLAALMQSAKPKHPRAWQSDFAHQRKLSSYRNECHFYAHYWQQTNAQCAVPRPMLASYSDAQISIVMEDLDAKGLHLRHMQASIEIAKTCITWLANFHAQYMQQPLEQLWPIGTYWHLATRPQEHEVMVASPLKEAARAIDDKLNQAQFKTLLHGDAKIANFCFSKDSKQTAAVDFQYTGKGVGVKDLIYFLGSCLNEHDLSKHAETLTDYYFSSLKNGLIVQSKEALLSRIQTTDLNKIEQEWRSLIPFAWADFDRFLAGWAPEHKKRHAYSHQQTALALLQL
jgi:hypothetical protein